MTYAAPSTRPQRTAHDPGAALLYYGLFAPPLAWTVQENVCFGLASHACFPEKAPLAQFLQGFTWVWTALLALNLALLVVSLIGVATSWLAWRRTRGAVETNPDANADPVEPGEGRVRVFAAAGLFVSTLFVIAIGVNTISLIVLSTCSVV